MPIRGVTGLLLKGKIRKAGSLASRKVKRTFGFGRYKVKGERQALARIGAMLRGKRSKSKGFQNRARAQAAASRTRRHQRTARNIVTAVTVPTVGGLIARHQLRKKKR